MKKCDLLDAMRRRLSDWRSSPPSQVRQLAVDTLSRQISELARVPGDTVDLMSRSLEDEQSARESRLNSMRNVSAGVGAVLSVATLVSGLANCPPVFVPSAILALAALGVGCHAVNQLDQPPPQRELLRELRAVAGSFEPEVPAG
ncbi:MAG: hypothetical protein AB1758_13280 [Candidatus Eremiobacterota bacterium]